MRIYEHATRVSGRDVVVLYAKDEWGDIDIVDVVNPTTGEVIEPEDEGALIAEVIGADSDRVYNDRAERFEED
jgi:hypothetical protein